MDANERYSYLVKFERRDNSPDEEYYYNGEDEAKEHFSLFNDLSDKDNAVLYTCISLEKIDWFNRRNENLDAICFNN